MPETERMEVEALPRVVLPVKTFVPAKALLSARMVEEAAPESEVR